MDYFNNRDKYYISVGSKVISREMFKPVFRSFDRYSCKPIGGFWACEYKDLFNISDWFNLLLNEPDIRKSKNISYATLFSLKHDSNILYIDDVYVLEKLISKYPSIHHILLGHSDIPLSYEALADCYDGIFVDIYKLSSQCASRAFSNWDINSLLLFNLDCIDKYQSMKINDENGFYYLSRIDGIKKDVSDLSSSYLALYSMIGSYMAKYLDKMDKDSYLEYLYFVRDVINRVRKSISIRCNSNVYNVLQNLRAEDISIMYEDVINNIIYSYIARYFKKKNIDYKYYVLKKNTL